MKKVLLVMFIIMATWMFFGCTPKMDRNGCFGYTYESGLQRGTRAGWNDKYYSPYRQCVDTKAPHRNLERR